MGTLTAGSVVLVPFPFSDLTQSKRRPAVLLASVAHGDVVLCQVTSNAYGDPLAVGIDDADFQHGGLRHASFARPGKLFSASSALVVATVGRLTREKHRGILEAIVALLYEGLRNETS
ncbi:MAG: type II toxin-antitoxin system PemK/MazF family toxin [Acidobacteriota bacterium]